MAREEIEEALVSDEPLELVLTVDRGAGSPQDVRVNWQRSDLETVLAGTDADGITFSFDRAELYRALEHPDFEGHGIREMVLLTVAAASASAALAASTASGQVLDTAGGGGGTSVTAVQPGDPGTIPYLSQGIGVDQSQFQGEASTAASQGEPGTIPYLSQGIGVDQSQFQGDASTAASQGEPGTIPYLSQGIGVDQSQFQGVTRGIESEPVVVDSGSSIEMPSVDPGTAAAIGGLAGASLLIVGAAFAARRRTTPV